MSGPAEVSADAEVCIGAGNCVVTAAGVFDLDDNGTVVVAKTRVTGEEADQAEAAADACPAFAIQVLRDARR
ncbi:MAG TPA: ferredoxin [Amycolatopsis sp.]|nr:ferredoxin [Amycolatopsis sp.]